MCNVGVYFKEFFGRVVFWEYISSIFSLLVVILKWIIIIKCIGN